MNNKSKDLLQLIKDNPDLPIVPMVDSEVVWDSTGYYMGVWGKAKIDEYIISKEYNDCVIFKSDGDVFDALERYMGAEKFKSLPETEDECQPFYDSLPWEKAIVVFIEPLD